MSDISDMLKYSIGLLLVKNDAILTNNEYGFDFDIKSIINGQNEVLKSMLDIISHCEINFK